MASHSLPEVPEVERVKELIMSAINLIVMEPLMLSELRDKLKQMATSEDTSEEVRRALQKVFCKPTHEPHVSHARHEGGSLAVEASPPSTQTIRDGEDGEAW